MPDRPPSDSSPLDAPRPDVVEAMLAELLDGFRHLVDGTRDIVRVVQAETRVARAESAALRAELATVYARLDERRRIGGAASDLRTSPAVAEPPPATVAIDTDTEATTVGGRIPWHKRPVRKQCAGPCQRILKISRSRRLCDKCLKQSKVDSALKAGLGAKRWHQERTLRAVQSTTPPNAATG